MRKSLRNIWKVLLVTLTLAFLSGCQTQLYGELAEEEANAVLALLLESGLVADKRSAAEGKYAVFVEETQFAQAVKLLDARGLPLRRYDDLGKVFGKDAMFSTPMEEKARYLYAMQEELSHTISTIDGVLAARLHLVLPEQDQLGRSLQTPSAAVFVKHIDDERHDPAKHGVEIRRLVAASVPNLDEDRIAVSFFPVEPTTNQKIVTPLRQVLGLRMAEESVARLWWSLGTAAAVILALAGLLAKGFLQRGKK